MRIKQSIFVAAFILLAWAIGGCGAFHPFAAGASGPDLKPLPHSTASVTSLDVAIWVGVGMMVFGIVMALALDQPKRGMGLILAGAATWAGASFLQEFRRPILIAAGVLTVGLGLFGLWEEWSNRKKLLADAKEAMESAGSFATGSASSPAPAMPSLSVDPVAKGLP